MKPETAGKIKYGISGLICGGIIAMIIGFNWGGWTTFSTSKTMTKEAVLASKAAICTAQFVKDPNYKEKLKEFDKLYSYGMNNTTDYVRKFGWDKMPGEKKADSNVAPACASGIELLIKK
ncbi:MAG: hypothetical protein Q8P24_09950 [Desulfobacterales bacterium]|nr:hypothetical protein [Desulfobacterales bacterium]